MTAIKVTLNGWEEGLADIDFASEHFQSVVSKELKTWGDDNVAWLQKKVRDDDLNLARKMRSNGKPPLIDSEKYINGYQCFLESPFSIGIVSVGMNDHMSNADLAELLEWGWDRMPARPHLRPLAVHMEQNVGILGAKIVRGIFRR